MLWGALLCTLVATANAEYTIALATHMNWFVAGAVPGALDLYVVQALRSRRDVLLAVLLMVAVNVASHLVAAGLLPVGWEMVSAVGAIPGLLLWRIHYLWRLGKRSPAPLPDESTFESTVPAPLPTEERWRERSEDEWLDALDDAPEGPWTATVPLLTVVPDPDVMSTPEPVPLLKKSTPESTAPEPLSPKDAEHEGALRAYLDTCQEDGIVPSVRGCKDFCKVGWDKAKRLMAWAGYPETEATT